MGGASLVGREEGTAGELAAEVGGRGGFVPETGGCGDKAEL